MAWRLRAAGILIGCLVLAGLLPTVAVGQQAEIIDVHLPTPLPYYLGEFDFESAGMRYGIEIADVAFILPMYFYRPIDDLTPRPGAQALAMGGAYTAAVSGPLGLAWNPAALGRMEEAMVTVDGTVRSSSSRSDDLPDTVLVEGQPEFNIQRYEVRLGGTQEFGFIGGAMPLVWIGGRPLVGGMAYRRHTDVAYGEETVLEMGLFEGSGFPFVLGVDNAERGSIESFSVGLGFSPLDLDAAWLSLGATANFLTGRLHSDVLSRISVRGFEEGHLTYRQRYKGFTVELGALAGMADLVRLGGWVGLPHSLYIYDGKFTNTPIIPPNVTEVYRVHAQIADYDLELPLFVTGGITVGPIRGVELSADINHRPWSEAEIRHRRIDYTLFDSNYPGADVTSYHVGGRFQFPLLRGTLQRLGLHLTASGGYRNLPLSMQDLDIFAGEAPYYLGEQIEGDAISFGLSCATSAKITFHVGLEVQSYKFRKWFLDDTRELDERELSFNDPWDRAPIIDRSVTLLRFSSEMHF